MPQYNLKRYTGPVCKVCQTRNADEKETVCYSCQKVFKAADRVSLSSSAIKRAMLDTGIPVRPKHMYNPGFETC